MIKRIVILLIAIVNFTLAAGINDGNSSALFQSGKYSEVIKLLETKLKTDSLNIPEKKELSYSYMRLFKHNNAIPLLREINSELPGEEEYMMALAECLGVEGMNIEAGNILHQIVSANPENIYASIELGKLMMERKSYGEALRIYDRLCCMDSTSSYYRRQKGYCYFSLDQADSSISCYKKALDINSKDLNAMIQLGRIYYKLERFEDSYDILSEAKVLNFKHIQLLRTLSEAALKIENFDAAALNYGELIALGDSSAANFQKLGLSYYYIGASQPNNSRGNDIKNLKFTEAMEAFTTADKKGANDPLTLLYIGILQKEKGETELAAETLEKAIENMYPDFIATAYIHLGSAYEMLNEYRESIIAYRKALKFRPSKKDLYFYLGSVYDRYYADRLVPKIYYQKFLRDAEDPNPILKEFAESRIEKLREELHFRK